MAAAELRALLEDLHGRAEAEMAQGLRRGNLFVLAGALERLGQPQPALRWLEHFLAAFPDHAEALRLKLRLLKALGRRAELVEWLGFLSREDPRLLALITGDER